MVARYVPDGDRAARKRRPAQRRVGPHRLRHGARQHLGGPEEQHRARVDARPVAPGGAHMGRVDRPEAPDLGQVRRGG